MNTDQIDQDAERIEPIAARDRTALGLGLLFPGGGQFKQGEWLGAALVMIATLFFSLCAALELVVNNMNSYPAPLHLWRELTKLHSPITFVPHVAVALIFALTLHVGAALIAWRRP